MKIEVRLEDENVWLTQNAMAELFNITRNNIIMHIKCNLKKLLCANSKKIKSIQKQQKMTKAFNSTHINK